MCRWQEAAARRDREESKKRAEKAKSDAEAIMRARQLQSESRVLAQAAVAQAEYAEFQAVLAKLKHEEELSKVKVLHSIVELMPILNLLVLCFQIRAHLGVYDNENDLLGN